MTAPSTTHALIAHLDIPRLMETGEARWQLIHVNLDTARQGVNALQAAKAYHDTPKFQLATRTTTVAANPEPVDRRTALLERYGQLNAAGQEMFAMLDLDRDDLDAVEAALDDLDPFTHTALTGTELVALQTDTLALVVETGGDDRAVRRCLLNTVTDVFDHTTWTEPECRQLQAVCTAFGNPLGLKFDDHGPSLVGDVAAILAAA